ncbi:MAG: hypothetical protein IPH94_13655 [Saprospiraceae bacterium]|nr:hypothetical protein [Saprospiraceae bacterium]
MRRRGQHGHPKEISYYQISSTDFAQKTSYGDGGIAGFNEVGSGYGGVVIHNTTTNTNITSTIARFGNQPGGGGGGAAGTSSLSVKEVQGEMVMLSFIGIRLTIKIV